MAAHQAGHGHRSSRLLPLIARQADYRGQPKPGQKARRQSPDKGRHEPLVHTRTPPNDIVTRSSKG